MDEGVDAGVLLAAAAAAGFASLFDSERVEPVPLDEAALASDVPSLFDSAFLAPPLVEEYRSEYHPPPFRMKLVPALMRRCAVGFPHLGHTSVGGAVMR